MSAGDFMGSGSYSIGRRGQSPSYGARVGGPRGGGGAKKAPGRGPAGLAVSRMVTPPFHPSGSGQEELVQEGKGVLAAQEEVGIGDVALVVGKGPGGARVGVAVARARDVGDRVGGHDVDRVVRERG